MHTLHNINAISALIAILLVGGCGGGNYETPEDPTRPTITVTATGIVLGGSVSDIGSSPMVADTKKIVVTVGGADASVLSGERATVNATTKTWSYTMPVPEDKQTVHIRYWVDNRLIETETVVITNPSPVL